MRLCYLNLEIQYPHNSEEFWKCLLKCSQRFTIEDGNQIHCTDMFECDKMAVLNWLDNTEIEKLKDNREPADMPSCSYKPQPNKIGKLLWISGIF